MLRKPQVQIFILTCACLLALYTSWSFYIAAKSEASSAYDSLHECQTIVNEMERFKNAPRIASLEVEPPDRIAARITSAAERAELSPLNFQSIDPQAASQIENSAYRIRPTNIILQNATLPQIASFIMHLEDADTGTFVRDLTLRRSDAISGNDSELWNVRMTLTQVIYSPISTQ